MQLEYRRSKVKAEMRGGNGAVTTGGVPPLLVVQLLLQEMSPLMILVKEIRISNAMAMMMPARINRVNISDEYIKVHVRLLLRQMKYTSNKFYPCLFVLLLI